MQQRRRRQQQPQENAKEQDQKEIIFDRRLWAPNFRTALSLFSMIRFSSVFINTISDCDETFNYWEPLHYLLYGTGLQTWEYSPIYALRSYLYLIFHGLFGRVFGLLLFGFQSITPTHKIGVFYGLRAALGFGCAFVEASFYRATVSVFGNRVGRYLLFFLTLSPGLFHSATAFLPSSFTMYAVMGVYTCWFTKQFGLAIFIGVCAVLCGWPYVALIFVVFAVDTFSQAPFIKTCLQGIGSVFIVLGCELMVEYYYYQRWVLPAFNIVNYNVLGGGGEGASSTLYGTEPWSFYIINGILNFNVVFLLAMLVGILLTIRQPTTGKRAMVYLAPLYLWCVVMFTQPHKEERFLFPVYPLICLAAAYALTVIYDMIGAYRVGRMGVRLTLVVFGVFSLSRIASQFINYHAPLDTFQQLHEHLLLEKASVNNTVCMGKEWYRFPSHFFLPHNTQLQFLKSGFKGQLPQPFSTSVHGTSRIPENMNHLNQEEPSRYVSVESCDYIVDFVLPSSHDAWIEQPQKWDRMFSKPFLHAAESRALYRAFYIPFLSAKFTTFREYVVFKKRK